jgi:hypothetical protein
MLVKNAQINRWLMLWAALALLPILNAVRIVLTHSANHPYVEDGRAACACHASNRWHAN